MMCYKKTATTHSFSTQLNAAVSQQSLNIAITTTIQFTQLTQPLQWMKKQTKYLKFQQNMNADTIGQDPCVAHL